MRRLFFGGLLCLLTATAALSVTLWWAQSHPVAVWHLVLNQFLPGQWQSQAGQVTFVKKKTATWSWNLLWQGKNVELRRRSPLVAAAFDEVLVEAQVTLFNPRLRIELNRLKVASRQPITWELDGLAADRNLFEELRGYVGWLEWLNRYVSITNLEISLAQLQSLAGGSGAWRSSLNGASAVAPAIGQDFHFAVTSPAGGDLHLHVQSERLGSHEPFVTLKSDLLGPKLALKGAAEMAFAQEVFHAVAKGDLSKAFAGHEKMGRFSGELKMDVESTRARLAAALDLRDLSGGWGLWPSVEGQMLIPLVPGTDWPDAPATFTAKAPLPTRFADPLRADLESVCKCKLPPQLQADASGTLAFRAVTRPGPAYKRSAGEARVNIEGLKNKSFELQLGAFFELFQEGAKFSLQPRLDSQLRIASFRAMHGLLKNAGLVLPEPLNSMDGTIEVASKGAINYDKDREEIPLAVKLHLYNELEKAKIETAVRVDLFDGGQRVNLFFNVLADELRLLMPPVTALTHVGASPPTVEEVLPSANGFKAYLYFGGRTAKPGAIQLTSPHVDPNVPLTLELDRAANGALLGSVRLEPFDLHYFKRSLQLKNFRLIIDNHEFSNSSVDGRIGVEQSDTQISIEISGTLSSPHIRLTSQPAMSLSDLVAQLLFERMSTDLTPEEAETALEFEQALADKAIGILGLSVFVGAPVQRFSYDKVNKSYTAEVKDAHGPSASLSSEWEHRLQKDLHKRVSKDWVLVASQVGRQLRLHWQKVTSALVEPSDSRDSESNSK